MKRARVFAAVILALAMVLSLNIGVFASSEATGYTVDFYDNGVYKTTATLTYDGIDAGLPDCGADGWKFEVYTENVEDGSRALCSEFSYTSSADNNVITEELMNMLSSTVDVGSAGYELRYEAYTNREQSGTAGSDAIRNEMSSRPTMQDDFFVTMGFASTASGGDSKYFEEGTAAPEETVFRFLNMTQELYGYVDEAGYVTISYEAYMNIANAYFVNAPEMKTYLINGEFMDAETERVYYYSGGMGSNWYWVLCDVEACEDGYKLRGLSCNGLLVDTAGYTEYVDYYVCNGYAYEIDSAVELTLVKDKEHGYRIAAYTEKSYYLADTEEMGDCLYVYNQETERFSDVYYCVYTNSGDYGIRFLYGSGHYTFDNHVCYGADMPVTWETAYDGSVSYGDYDCLEVEVTRTFEGETQTSITGNSGVLSGGGEVWLWANPAAVFQISAEHATVEVIQGLADRGDGTYCYNQGDAIELKITPDAGYEVTEVASYIYDVYVVMGEYISASGTWVIHPEFLPSTILVTTGPEALRTDGDGTGITIVSGEDSPAAVTVQISEEEAEKVYGLTLVVEELEATTEKKAVSMVTEQLGAEEDNVYILDIHFENTEGEETQVNASMVVTVPIPEGWDAANVGVYYVNPDTDEVVDMKAVVSEDGKTVTFTTNHFSYYALVQTAADNTTNPQTGDSSNIALWFVLMAVSTLGLGAALLYGEKKKASR